MTWCSVSIDFHARAGRRVECEPGSFDCAARRAQTARQKKPGRSAPDDSVEPRSAIEIDI